jgi:hypothetical protein
VEKIFDTIIFSNELDLLEIRLNILHEHVDFFIIVEAGYTFQGNKKGFNFELNKKKFKKFIDKIIYLKIHNFPDGHELFECESFQRNFINKALSKNAIINDIIILSDVDEIPDPKFLNNLRIKKFKYPLLLKQSLFYYYINLQCNELMDLPWSIIYRYSPEIEPQCMRDLIVSQQALIMGKEKNFKQEGFEFIDSAGWHFSYLGGAMAIKQKLESFSHRELNKKEFSNIDYIDQIIKSQKDLFGRNLSFKKLKKIDFLPEYIKENLHKFQHLIC